MEFTEYLLSGQNFREKKDIKFLNPLVMAFVGDSIYSVYVKTKCMDLFSEKVNNLTKHTAEMVNAKAQEQALFKILEQLTEEERDVVRRARNANIHTRAKNYSVDEYRHATALEALIGYLYLSKDEQRLQEVFDMIFNEDK